MNGPKSPTNDPLLTGISLDLGTTISVVGVPTSLRTNSARVLEAFESVFGPWKRALKAPPEGLVEVRVAVNEADESATSRAPMTFRVPDPGRVLFFAGSSAGVVDAARGDAVAYVTSDLIEDLEAFQEGVLSMMTLVLVTCRDRYPIHASMLERDGAAVILAAPSGVGKSTLAYQAVQDGWRLLGDDAVYVQTSPDHRLWSSPGKVLLCEDAVRWFPELAGHRARPQANGKVKIPVDVAHRGTLEPVDLQDAQLCILRRGSEPLLERVPPAAALAALMADLAFVKDLYGPPLRHAVEAVTGRGAWRLTLTDDPNQVRTLLNGLTHRTPPT